jgi:hypothetical protein
MTMGSGSLATREAPARYEHGHVAVPESSEPIHKLIRETPLWSDPLFCQRIGVDVLSCDLLPDGCGPIRGSTHKSDGAHETEGLVSAVHARPAHQWQAVDPESVNAPFDGRKCQSYEFACKVSWSTPWWVLSRTAEFGWGGPNP